MRRAFEERQAREQHDEEASSKASASRVVFDVSIEESRAKAKQRNTERFDISIEGPNK